jgi:chorismate synthase
MMGCTYGTLFQTSVAGGSYQEGLTTHIQGCPPGMYFTEADIYAELLLRKPGQGELSSPRREPDIPIIYSGVNAADTMPGFKNKGYTNGTPLVILIPNLDRHFEHIDQYQRTNRTPRPGHASYASYQKYGEWDDSIGAGFFSGRYTATIVAAGAVARRILAMHGIDVFAYVKEAAGVAMPDMPMDKVCEKVAAYKEMRRDNDAMYDLVYGQKRITPDMRFVEKVAALAEVEKMIPEIAARERKMDVAAIRAKGIHPLLNCPDLAAADAMYEKIVAIKDSGDSSGGLVEVVVTGAPAGLGEPVFRKLEGELGRMMSIGCVKAVESGAGYRVKDMVGSESNDQMYIGKDGKVAFRSNNAGGITGGLTTGQPIVARLAVKPTPTIAKDQTTIDKVSLTDARLAAVTRRDPTIVSRVWPVAEAFTAIILTDMLMAHFAYRGISAGALK